MRRTIVVALTFRGPSRVTDPPPCQDNVSVFLESVSCRRAERSKGPGRYGDAKRSSAANSQHRSLSIIGGFDAGSLRVTLREVKMCLMRVGTPWRNRLFQLSLLTERRSRTCRFCRLVPPPASQSKVQWACHLQSCAPMCPVLSCIVTGVARAMSTIALIKQGVNFVSRTSFGPGHQGPPWEVQAK